MSHAFEATLAPSERTVEYGEVLDLRQVLPKRRFAIEGVRPPVRGCVTHQPSKSMGNAECRQLRGPRLRPMRFDGGLQVTQRESKCSMGVSQRASRQFAHATGKRGSPMFSRLVHRFVGEFRWLVAVVYSSCVLVELVREHPLRGLFMVLLASAVVYGVEQQRNASDRTSRKCSEPYAWHSRD
jgi:hypothetical protein